jgi:integrase
MSGSIHYQKRGKCFFVLWYDRTKGKSIKIYRYRGTKIYDRRIAVKLLAQMQGDAENGILNLEKFLKQEWCEPLEYLWTWLKEISGTLAPATVKDYEVSIRHMTPFFAARRIFLHEVGYDTLQALANSINRGPKGKKNVLGCLHACLTYAWRSGRIPSVPPFPKIKYQPPAVRWLPEDRQMAIINAIPEADRPIFLFLKYHLRRPGEACALKWEDWDENTGTFTIHRGMSARRITESTKTGATHIVPCHKEFRSVLRELRNDFGIYIFRNPLARTHHKNYTLESLNRIWKKACEKAGEKISLYAGLKHSTACQLVNDHGLSMSELQAAGDWARLDSVKRYAVTEVARRKELLEGKVIRIDPKKILKGGQDG